MTKPIDYNDYKRLVDRLVLERAGCIADGEALNMSAIRAAHRYGLMEALVELMNMGAVDIISR